jgi:hypothetical protein
LAGLAVIEPVAIADIKTVSGAVPPDRVLDKPWKRGGKMRVEGACVDMLGDFPDDLGTITLAVVCGRYAQKIHIVSC